MSTHLGDMQVSGSKENLKKIRSFVRTKLKDTNLNEVDVNLITLAIDEICSNKIIHSIKENEQESIEIIVSNESNKIVFDIIDNGEKFEYQDYEEPELNTLVSEKRKGSLGMILIRKIMDEVSFLTEGNRNICRVAKNLPVLDIS